MHGEGNACMEVGRSGWVRKGMHACSAPCEEGWRNACMRATADSAGAGGHGKACMHAGQLG